MIAHLEGMVSFVGERYLVLSVGGVGYKIFASQETIRSARKEKGSVRLFTYMAIRENAHELYGFTNRAELEFFEMLLNVSGIGPKSALGIISLAPVESLKKAISSGDTSYLTKVSGIGRKTSEKIIIELRDKLGSSADVTLPELREEADTIEALKSLGYSHAEAREALKQVPEKISGTSVRLKEALKILSNGGK